MLSFLNVSEGADEQTDDKSTGKAHDKTADAAQRRYAEAADEAVDLHSELAAKNAGLDTLVGGLKQLSGALTVERTTYSAGIRYDFEPGAAFKVQFDSIKPANQDEDLQVVRFGLDVVF